MKTTFSTISQFLLFLIVFGAGSLFPPFHVQRILSTTSSATRIFVADGLLLMLALYLLLLLIEALTSRIRTAAPWTTLALLLAAIIGLAMKFGFLTRSAF